MSRSPRRSTWKKAYRSWSMARFVARHRRSLPSKGARTGPIRDREHRAAGLAACVSSFHGKRTREVNGRTEREDHGDQGK
jgi:hypothetical protein